MMLEECLRQAEAQLRSGPHPGRARQDAETLLLRVLGRNRAFLLAHSNDLLDGERAAAYLALIQRRLAGEPIQYITGEAEFYGLPFRVTPAVLIPRPETEHLVEKVLELAASLSAPRIVDVGTGSGAIAIALAAHLPAGSITATDISAYALSIARQNAERNGVAARIRFAEGDLLAPLAGEQFQIVASNPPYVSTADSSSLAVEVRDHEPAQALFAGINGLDVYRRLIPAARAALVSGGFLALEIGHGQAPEVGALLTASGFAGVAFTPDLQGIPRVATARRP